jgi:hypothetical protein
MNWDTKKLKLKLTGFLSNTIQSDYSKNQTELTDLSDRYFDLFIWLEFRFPEKLKFQI